MGVAGIAGFRLGDTEGPSEQVARGAPAFRPPPEVSVSSICVLIVEGYNLPNVTFLLAVIVDH